MVVIFSGERSRERRRREGDWLNCEIRVLSGLEVLGLLLRFLCLNIIIRVLMKRSALPFPVCKFNGVLAFSTNVSLFSYRDQ